MNSGFVMLLPLAAALAQDARSATLQPIIDNERVTVWDLAPGAPRPAKREHEGVTVYLTAGGSHKAGDAVYQQKGAALGADPARIVVIELKDHAVAPMKNTSGLPNAFPRPGVKKILENARVIVWDYSWTTGVPTPMHFHDKDVVVTYLEDGNLKSTTPAGASVVNEYSFGTVRFNLRDRTHYEELVKGKQRAIIMEFK